MEHKTKGLMGAPRTNTTGRFKYVRETPTLARVSKPGVMEYAVNGG
jgi:hypothetical protein